MMINWHLFHQNQKNESSYVRIGPEIKKLVFFLDLVVFSAYFDIMGGLKRVKYPF